MKYNPSVKTNNDKKDKVVSELKSTIFSFERGKFHHDLDREGIFAILASLKEEASVLDNTVGTGSENVESIAEQTLAGIRELKKASEQSYLNRFEKAADDLVYTLGCWRSMLSGDVGDTAGEDFELEKITWTRKKLNARLDELANLKAVFASHEARLESEIKQTERDLSELDALMLREDNERKINDLYRKISALRSKSDMLGIRKNNYSACYNILDMIYFNASEIVEASDIAEEEIGRAKALLNLSKLRAVLSEPDKAMAILKRMQDDVNALAEHTKNMDKKVFALNTSVNSVSPDAMKYKEDLMKRQREKEVARADGEALRAAGAAKAVKPESEKENANGIL